MQIFLFKIYLGHTCEVQLKSCGSDCQGMSLRIKTVSYFNLFSQLWLVLYSGANMLFLQFPKINGSLVV